MWVRLGRTLCICRPDKAACLAAEAWRHLPVCPLKYLSTRRHTGVLLCTAVLQERMFVPEWNTFNTENPVQDAVVLLFDVLYEALGVFKKQYWMGTITMQVQITRAMPRSMHQHLFARFCTSLFLYSHIHAITCHHMQRIIAVCCQPRFTRVVRQMISGTCRACCAVQNPFDMMSIADIIFTVKPDLIIETGGLQVTYVA
jgi:hypothetical protein